MAETSKCQVAGRKEFKNSFTQSLLISLKWSLQFNLKQKRFFFKMHYQKKKTLPQTNNKTKQKKSLQERKKINKARIKPKMNKD